MQIIADLHIHSKYARATSKNLSFENLETYAKVKGLDLLGTGDFQHPLHRKEIDAKLKEDDKGILWTEKGFPFIWQTELSFMYTQGGKGRAVHLVVLCPNGKTADKITKYLLSKGRVDYDGRPIFGITAKDFVKDMKAIDDKIEIIPAHCMTSWFGVFGSKKGFNSLKECFEEQDKHIYAVESGMSADPQMLWRFKEDVNVVSFSDLHSYWPWRIGREATIFDIEELSYDNIIKAIRTGQGLKATIETPPEYGKYHWDGHRKCDFSCSPSETKKLNGKCPKCGKEMVIGVEYRVEEIAKENGNYLPKDAKPFYLLLPLHELISFNIKSSLATQKTWAVYNPIIQAFGNELKVLLEATEQEMIDKNIDKTLINLILKNREGKLKVKPGYDGEYGVLIVSEGDKQKKLI